MPGLVLRLRPFETVMINGALIENGERESRLRVASENAQILRMKNALSPEEATTPVKKAYLIAQEVLMGARAPAPAAADLAIALQKLSDESDADALQKAAADLADENFYGVMRALGGLFERDAA
ncbi:MAG: flagellar biosynthesis repressor FlbT [Pseudomonadota bacterium]